MFVKHCLPLACIGLLALNVVSAQEEVPQPEVPPRLLIDTQDATIWNGGSPDTTIVREGIPATIRWDHAKAPALRATTFPTDWTGPHNAIEFWLHSQSETRSSFMFIIASENPNTDGMDYYQMKITLNFSGWRKFTVPLKNFGIAREPLGWNQITAVYFTAEGWGNTPNPESVVNVGPFRLVYISPTHGPRVKDKEFFNCLNLDYPGMEAVKAAVADNDLNAAKAAFVKHLKTREKPLWYFDWRKFNDPSSRNPNYNLTNADKYASNLLVSCGIWHQFGDKVEWDINPTELKYNEWTWQLSRHPFWTELGRAYWATGDEKYAKAFVSQLRSWIIDNPVPFDAGNVAYSRWRTIETGIRTFSSWPNSFFYFLASPSFDDDSIILMVKSFYEHAIHLRMFPQRNNWLCMEMNGLYHIGTLFPEFKEAAEWRQYAGDRLYSEMNIQVYPDGAQVELAPGYHGVSLVNFLGTYKLAQLNNQPLPADYVSRLEKMYGMYLNVTSPAGQTPALNDSGWAGTRGPCKEAAELFPNRKDFLYWGTEGKEGTVPSFTSNFMPYAGWFTTRTGWDPEALWLHMEAGPFGAGHQHEDKLTFAIHAYGTRLLTEGGTYAYDSSQWRRYVLSARAHNIVRVDGLDQCRWKDNRFNLTEKPLDNRWITNEQYDFAEGIYNEGFGKELQLKVSHSRAILFIKPNYWLLFDVMSPEDDLEHEYTSWFHFNTDQTLKLDAFNGYISADENTANLLIAPLNPNGLDAQNLCGQEQPEVQGWLPAGGYRCRPIATPTFVRKAKGVHAEPYLLYPVRAGEELPVKQIKSLGGNSFEIIFKDGSKHAVQFTLGKQYLDSLKWSSFDQNGKLTSSIVIE